MISDNATHTERFVGCRPRRLCYWRGHQEQLVIAPLSARGQSSTTEASSSTTYYRPRSGLAAELLAVARRRSSRPRAWKRSETYIHTSTTTVTSNGLSSSLRLRHQPSRRRKNVKVDKTRTSAEKLFPTPSQSRHENKIMGLTQSNSQ